MANNPPSNRAYAAAHFALELGNKEQVGLFRSIEGGGVKADVMTYQQGAFNAEGYKRLRQLGKPKFDDIKIQVGMAMSEAFYNWLSDFFDGKATRKSGAILAADFYYKERARRDFKEALIKEMTFPKLDASDKNAVYMGITMSVEEINFLKGTGAVLDVPKGFDAQKLWTACNFGFNLHGFEAACRRVTKIDSFTVKQNIIEYHAGGLGHPTKYPSVVEFPNISFYLPEADAQPFYDYVNKHMGFGPNTVRDPAQMTGSITAYDSENHMLMELDFGGADVVSVTPDRSDASSEEVKQVKVEIYTERMSMSYPAMDLE